jgi:hypothetical protein
MDYMLNVPPKIEILPMSSRPASPARLPPLDFLSWDALEDDLVMKRDKEAYLEITVPRGEIYLTHPTMTRILANWDSLSEAGE